MVPCVEMAATAFNIHLMVIHIKLMRDRRGNVLPVREKSLHKRTPAQTALPTVHQASVGCLTRDLCMPEQWHAPEVSDVGPAQPTDEVLRRQTSQQPLSGGGDSRVQRWEERIPPLLSIAYQYNACYTSP
jgi:hypothetical protein